ncbi:hypothetical protein C6Q28_17090 [Burkholderia multivorans]|uniref:Uncharacterized protein n=2 Tax=Burkholderia multivorans TaxID=87883 RepID=A0A0H3KSG2_BURM1|nr:hypothetical protein B1M_00185 [Burkholderia sp. TJI49]PRF58962.1 hypothetical protein C6Q28_17090 [Burkholderia multivorans]PRF64237.1 hypothetical protein C6Q15_06235 [Burkholderia multivorans]BAG48007.1 hypothetical protein BMULJ_06218 [Burkholderia multivorans ATCC 17616]
MIQEIKMRGLDVRVNYALAKIKAIVDPQSDLVIASLYDAQAEGYYDYQAGVYSVPTMFADVPELVAEWEWGQQMAEECDAVSQCPDCQNDSGNPCPVHG